MSSRVRHQNPKLTRAADSCIDAVECYSTPDVLVGEAKFWGQWALRYCFEKGAEWSRERPNEVLYTEE